ncbi:amino acid adenylation domain-containing protein [Streptomyces sp. NPDC058595]|uniref:amino acid adenylation domain-containing protein n=1 Tax=Streptomyces sp. NPDC058595 TaxID=3346550 RepID=UPI0036636F40
MNPLPDPTPPPDPIPDLDLMAVAALAVHHLDHSDTVLIELAGHNAGDEPRRFTVAVDPREPFAQLAHRATAQPAPPGPPADCRLTVTAGPPNPRPHGTSARHEITIDPATGRTTAHTAAPAEADTLHRLVTTLLHRTRRDRARPVGAHDLLDDEQRLDIALFNATDAPFPDDLTLVDLLHAQAAATPTRVAVSTASGTLTYGELADRAERLATFLAGRDHGPHGLVAVTAQRSLDLPVALFGVLAAGLAYLPLDPRAPAARLRRTLARCGVTTLLTDRATAGAPGLRDLPADLFPLDDPALRARTGGAKPPGPTDLCYVIHTSGSTGEPKGVMVEHRSVVNRLTWMQRRFPLTADDVVLQKTPTVFDVSVWELFCWVLAGARMHLLPPGTEVFPLAVEDAIAQHGVTVTHFVPSMLDMVLGHVAASGTAPKLRGLRRCFASGETLLPATAAAFDRLLGPYGCRLVNLYGPTETTVDVTAHPLPPGPPPSRIPIGRPIDNTRVHVLRHGRPVPVGVYGTLFVAGAGVARGYLDDEARTAERFVPEPGHPGARMYDTGDIGRWTPAGELEYLGRDDLQVKIRGIRVEPGEVEHALTSLPQVTGCAVHVHAPDPSRAVLHAVLTGSPDLTAAALRSALTAELPGHLVPSAFVRVETMPRTPTGKLDRALLADPEYLRTHGVHL